MAYSLPTESLTVRSFVKKWNAGLRADSQLRLAMPARDFRLGGDGEAAWRFIDWLVRTWAPAWLDFADEGNEENAMALRATDPIAGYCDIMEAMFSILTIRCNMRGNRNADDVAGLLDVAARRAMRRSWDAAYHGAEAETAPLVLDDMTAEVLDYLWTSVAAIVAERERSDFAEVTQALHASAAEMLASLADDAAPGLAEVRAARHAQACERLHAMVSGDDELDGADADSAVVLNADGTLS